MQLRRAGTALAVVGFLGIAVATLTPVRDLRGEALLTPLTCLVCGERGGADVVLNLLLFLPLAIGLRLSGQSWIRTVLLAAAISFTVELLQYRIVPGRDASLSDLLSNTTSGAIGATIGPVLLQALMPTRRRASALLAGGVTFVLALLAASAWLLSPDLPDGRLISRRAPPTGLLVFGGQVRAVRLDGLPMPAEGSPPDSAVLRRGLDRGSLTLEAEVVSAAPPADGSWIYLLSVPSVDVLTLTQRERVVGVEVPSRALRYYFRAPSLSLADGLPAAPGVPVRLLATERGGRMTLTSEYDGVQRSVEFGISPAYGWSMLLPFDLAVGPGTRWITCLVLAALFFPLGFWAAWMRRPAAAVAALAGALLLTFAALPEMAGFPPVHWSEWLGGILGAAAGWAAQRPAAYLERRCVSLSGSEFSSS